MLYNQDYTDYQANRSPVRKLIRRIYLNNIMKYISGRTIDFGCGTGELLSMLPEGSIGLEINQASVEYCLLRKLNAALYKPDKDGYKFSFLPANTYKTFVMVHVFEHLENAASVIKTIFASCSRLGVDRIILVVPGKKGFESDDTHKTFINEKYLKENNLIFPDNYFIKKQEHFPFNISWAGNIFKHNEYLIIYDKKDKNLL